MTFLYWRTFFPQMLSCKLQPFHCPLVAHHPSKGVWFRCWLSTFDLTTVVCVKIFVSLISNENCFINWIEVLFANYLFWNNIVFKNIKNMKCIKLYNKITVQNNSFSWLKIWSVLLNNKITVQNNSSSWELFLHQET